MSTLTLVPTASLSSFFSFYFSLSLRLLYITLRQSFLHLFPLFIAMSLSKKSHPIPLIPSKNPYFLSPSRSKTLFYIPLPLPQLILSPFSLSLIILTLRFSSSSPPFLILLPSFPFPSIILYIPFLILYPFSLHHPSFSHITLPLSHLPILFVLDPLVSIYVNVIISYFPSSSSQSLLTTISFFSFFNLSPPPLTFHSLSAIFSFQLFLSSPTHYTQFHYY